MMDVTQAKAMPVLVPADLGLVRERAAALGLTGTDAKVCLICAEVTMPTGSRAPSPCQQYGPYLFRLSRVQELHDKLRARQLIGRGSVVPDGLYDRLVAASG